MAQTIFKHAAVVTMNPQREILYDGAVVVEGDTILDVGPTAVLEQKYPGAGKVFDCTNKAVFPGLINTHNHLFQTLMKGLGDDMVVTDWSRKVMFPSSRYLTAEDCYAGAVIGCVEGLHSGVTTQLDYMYPHPVPNLSDAVIQVFKDMKLRCLFGRGYFDEGPDAGKYIRQTPAEIEADIRRLVKEYQGAEHGRIGIWLAPSSVWMCSRETWEMTARLMKDLQIPLTIHISETRIVRENAVRVFGATDIDVLEQLGVLGEHTLMVHCVELNERDIRMTKELGGKISYNPVSNMYLSSGVPPITLMDLAGLDIGLATDGAASNNSNDMLEVLKAAALLQKVHTQEPSSITAERVLEMATIDGARAVGMADQIGSLEPGKKADLFVFNPARNMKAIPMLHPVSTLVYSSSNENVETVMCDGNLLMENGRVTVLDEAKWAEKCRICAEDLSRRSGTDTIRRRPWRSRAY